MTFRKIAALLLCALMLTTTACSSKPVTSGNNSVPSMPSQTTRTVVNTTTSVFLGSWNVQSQHMSIDTLTFLTEGTLRVTFDGESLGGTFYDDGVSRIEIIISASTISGTYTVDGNTITIVTDNDTLVLTKM